jgi:hypothetical protein
MGRAGSIVLVFFTVRFYLSHDPEPLPLEKISGVTTFKLG